MNEDAESTVKLADAESAKRTPLLRVNELITPIEYGPMQIKMIFLAFLIVLIEGIHLTMHSSMLIPIKELYHLDTGDIIIMSASMYIGVGFGSFSAGFLAKILGRRQKIVLLSGVLAIFNILLGLIENYFFFSVLRFIIGILIGATVPTAINMLCEYLPLEFRGFYLVTIWSGLSVGTAIPNIIMLFTMPNFEPNGVGSTILITSIAPLLYVILAHYFLEDSPRNLVTRNKVDKAVDLIEQHRKESLPEDSINLLAAKGNESQEHPHKGHLKEIFVGDYLVVTVAFIVTWFINSVISYGPILILSLTLKELDIQDAKSNNYHSIIVQQIIVALIYSVGYFLAGSLCELPSIGRKKTIILGYSGTILFIALGLVFTRYFSMWFGIYQASVALFNTTTIFSAEVYPTKVRDMALGFLFFMTRIGGCTSQILYILLNDFGIFFPYYFTIVMAAVALVATWVIPFETHGKDLDIH